MPNDDAIPCPCCGGTGEARLADAPGPSVPRHEEARLELMRGQILKLELEFAEQSDVVLPCCIVMGYAKEKDGPEKGRLVLTLRARGVTPDLSRDADAMRRFGQVARSIYGSVE